MGFLAHDGLEAGQEARREVPGGPKGHIGDAMEDRVEEAAQRPDGLGRRR